MGEVLGSRERIVKSIYNGIKGFFFNIVYIMGTIYD